MKTLQNREELILKFLPKVEATVSAYVWANPYFGRVKDDLISVGHVKLIEAVDRFLGKKAKDLPHLSNYIRISILTGIADFIRTINLVHGPKSQFVPCGPLNSEPLDDRTPEHEKLTRDDLERVCESPEERVLLAMALRGCTNKEIAETLCISRIEARRRLVTLTTKAKNHGN